MLAFFGQDAEPPKVFERGTVESGGIVTPGFVKIDEETDEIEEYIPSYSVSFDDPQFEDKAEILEEVNQYITREWNKAKLQENLPEYLAAIGIGALTFLATV